MKNRTYFLGTALSGTVGMLALITASLLQTWISKNDPRILSDEAADRVHFYSAGLPVAIWISRVAIIAFVAFLVLYLTSRVQGTSKKTQLDSGRNSAN